MATTIGKLNAILTLNSSKFERGLKRSQSSLGRFGASAKRVTKVLGVMGVAAAAAGAGALVVMTKRSLAAIDATAKFADSVGIATAKLVGLEHAATITGVSSEALRKSLIRMTVNIGDAANGIGEARQTLDELGLSADALAAMSPDKQFEAIAEAISKVPTATGKATAAYRLFGRSGVQLINTLNLGSAGIAAMQAEAEKLGITFDREAAAKAEMANDAMTRLNSVFKGMSQTIAIELAPYITALADKLVAVATQGEGMGAKVSKAFEWVVRGAAKAYEWMQLLSAAAIAVQSGFLAALAGVAKGVDILANTMLGVVRQFTGINVELKATHTLAANLWDLAKEADEKSEAAFFGWLDGSASRSAEQFIRKIEKNADAAAAKIAEGARQGDGLAVALGEAAEEAEALDNGVDAAAKRMERMTSDARRVWDQTRTPLERYNMEIEKLKALFAEGLISEETLGRAWDQAWQDLQSQIERDVADIDPSGGFGVGESSQDGAFRQVRLNRLARTENLSMANKKQKVEDPQLKETNEILARIETNIGGSAARAV